MNPSEETEGNDQNAIEEQVIEEREAESKEPELVVEALSNSEVSSAAEEKETSDQEFASDDGSDLVIHPSLEEECDKFLKVHDPVPVQAGIYPSRTTSTSDRHLESSSSREDSTTTDEDRKKPAEATGYSSSTSSQEDDTLKNEDKSAAVVAFPPPQQQPAQAVQPKFRKMARRDSGPGSRNKWNYNKDEYFSAEEREDYHLPPADDKVMFEKAAPSPRKKKGSMKRRGSMGAVETGAAELYGELSDDAADEFLDPDTLSTSGAGDHTYLEEAEQHLFLAVNQQRARDEAARRSLCDIMDVEENVPSSTQRKKKSRRSRRHQSVFEQRRSGKPRVPRPRPRSSKRAEENLSGRSLVTVPADTQDTGARIGTFRLSNAVKVRSPEEMLKKSPSRKKMIMIISCLFFGIATVAVGSVFLFPDLMQFDSAALLNTSPFFRGTAAMRNENILWAPLGPHPDYTGAIAPVEGEVTLVFDRFSQITASLHLPNIISQNCHWEILTGRTCEDSERLGRTPFYNQSLWQAHSPYEGQTHITTIHIGYTAAETVGQAIVVYAPGPYYQVACGILQYQPTTQQNNNIVVVGNVKK